MGRGSSVGIVTRYGLGVSGIETRWGVGGARFSAPVQTDPGAQTVSYKMGTGSLSQGVERPGRGVEHPASSSVEVKERGQL